MQLDYKASGVSIIVINNTIDVVKEILKWVEKVNDVELLKNQWFLLLQKDILFNYYLINLII